MQNILEEEPWLYTNTTMVDCMRHMPCRLMYLNTWYPISGAFVDKGVFMRCSLAGGNMSLGGGGALRVYSQTHSLLSASVCGENATSQLSALANTPCLPMVMESIPLEP